MSVLKQGWCILGLALLCVATPAAANKFTVALHNGTKFETLRQPREAGWDRTMVMVLTDAGNWIAIPQEEIAGVTVEIEVKGFGKLIDDKTIEVGTSINDAPTDEEEQAAAQQDPMSRILEQLNQSQPQQPNYSVDQFVNPDDAGGGGLPASYGGGGGNSVSVFSFNQSTGGGSTDSGGGDGGQ